MTGYNKLKIAILAIMTSQTVSAITIDPIQVQSGSGDLLYAEMKFSNSDPNAKIDVGLADADDIQNIGVQTQAPGHLNFYTRRSSDGSGVIVITSSRPIVESELNVLLKIKEGSATHIQQVKAPLTRGRTNNLTQALNALNSNNEKPLTPQIIVSEKDIALNLPTSTQYQSTLTQPQSITKAVNTNSANSGSQSPLTISVIAPPSLQTQPKTTNTPASATTSPKLVNNNQVATNTASTPTPAVVPQAIVQAPIKSEKPVQPESIQEKQAQASKPVEAKQQETKTKSADQTKKVDSTKSKENGHKDTSAEKAQVNKATDKDPKHIVQANESLWKIASRIAAETHQSIPEVMKQIKANNANAFIQGDMNRIRRGAALNLAATYQQTPTKYKVPTTAPIVTRKQSGSAKYRLDQAEMSLIADNEQTSAQGSSKKNTQMNQTTTELSTKVMTSREKTVKLQKNVTQLASALQQKNQRIQLLNARLAQLQQQLQQQNVKKPNS